MKWPDCAHRKLDRESQCEKSLRSKHALKEFRIKHQLQLARRFRQGLAILRLQELSVGNEVKIMLSRHVMRRLRRRPRFQLPPNRCALLANEPP